ncbi:MAG: hypothetical protein MJ179_03750, partial [Treponema sp.]|nr:hypothetical protein [Treponema sp.]
MNDSTENTNELDSYGVWVKNTPENEATDMPAENTLEPSDSLDFSDALDLPDFDTDTSFESSDLDDIFNDSNPLSDETPLTQDDDTTLNSDELLNITNGVDLIETEETPVIEDSFNFDDSFNIDDSLSDDSLSLDEPAVIDENLSIDDSTAFDDSLSLDDNILVDDPLSINETPVEENLSFDDPFETEPVETEPVDASETIAEETSDFDNSFSFDEITTEDAPALDENFADAADALVMEDSDFSLDSFETETPVETEITDEPVAETEVEAVSENETIESFGEESITVESNDDESVSIESFGDEEISLDDFMDGGFSDESVAAGNNGYEPGNPNSPSASSFVPSSSGSEEISLDDFIEGGFEVEKEKEQEVLDEKPLEMDISFDNSVDEVKTEANFSIDHDNFDDEETVDEVAVTEETSDDVIVSSSENIEAEEIDLSDFGIDADAEETPVTQDIEASKVKEQVIDYDLTVENDNAVVAPIVNEIRDNDADNNVVEPAAESTAAVAAPAVDMSLLQQIVSELSSLKDEINHLKSNLNEIKTKEPEEPVISEDLGITENKDEGGFFGSDDTDDTIALTTDELSNIMATETFVEEPAVEEP